MDETHRLLAHQREVMTYALILIAMMALAATFIAGWVVWITRNMGREGREFQKELQRRSEQLDYYFFGKLGPLETK